MAIKNTRHLINNEYRGIRREFVKFNDEKRAQLRSFSSFLTIIINEI